jgi:hypothetical protein
MRGSVTIAAKDKMHLKKHKQNKKKTQDFLANTERSIAKTKSLPAILNLPNVVLAQKGEKFSLLRKGQSKKLHKYLYRSWSSSPNKNKYLGRKLPQYESEVQPLPKTVAISMSYANARTSFVAFTNVNIHEHDHNRLPHLHRKDCERFTSGFDRNRQSRYYFTKQKTPLRVYVNYDSKLTDSSSDISIKPKESEFMQVLTGRKLSPRTLKSHFKVSPNFIDDAKNLVFVKETMSFVPQYLPTISQTTMSAVHNMTLAEMAVMPFQDEATKLPDISKQTQQTHVKKQSKITSSMASLGSVASMQTHREE